MLNRRAAKTQKKTILLRVVSWLTRRMMVETSPAGTTTVAAMSAAVVMFSLTSFILVSLILLAGVSRSDVSLFHIWRGACVSCGMFQAFHRHTHQDVSHGCF